MHSGRQRVEVHLRSREQLWCGMGLTSLTCVPGILPSCWTFMHCLHFSATIVKMLALLRRYKGA